MIKRQDQTFSIVDLRADDLVGRCLLFDINPMNRRAWLGQVIGEKVSCVRAYRRETIKMLLDYGISVFHLNNIKLGMVSFNERALACYRMGLFKEFVRWRQARILGRKRISSGLLTYWQTS